MKATSALEWPALDHAHARFIADLRATRFTSLLHSPHERLGLAARFGPRDPLAGIARSRPCAGRGCRGGARASGHRGLGGQASRTTGRRRTVGGRRVLSRGGLAARRERGPALDLYAVDTPAAV